MLKYSFTTGFLLLICVAAFSQDAYESWNKRYTETNITDMLQFERAYADSVDRGLIEGKYYARLGLYQVDAEYLGRKRAIADSTVTSIRNVNKLFGEKDFSPVISRLENEYLFRVDSVDHWFAMQDVLEDPFKKEVSEHDTVLLYCMFFNEHHENGVLYNTFLISEFRKE